MAYPINIPIEGITAQFDIEFGFEAVYTGAYEIDPTVDGLVLETANKRMLKDVTVNRIGVSDVENKQGGRTITIAGN